MDVPASIGAVIIDVATGAGPGGRAADLSALCTGSCEMDVL